MRIRIHNTRTFLCYHFASTGWHGSGIYPNPPPSLLDSSISDVEQFWSKLAHELHLDPPAPYTTFQELYQRIYPYLWLHSRLWDGDRAIYGTLLVKKYCPRTGKIEFTRIQAKSGGGLLSDGTGETPRLEFGPALLGLQIELTTTLGNDGNLPNPYSFHRVSAISGVGQSPSNEQVLWPPLLFPAADRTSRSHAASRHHGPHGERVRHSLNLFELRKASTSGFGLVSGPRVELFSSLDAKLYTPDLEHPLRGIWWCNYHADYEFILFHQASRYHLDGLKLTGDWFVRRRCKTLGFDNIQAEGVGGKILAGFGSSLSEFLPVP